MEWLFIRDNQNRLTNSNQIEKAYKIGEKVNLIPPIFG